MRSRWSKVIDKEVVSMSEMFQKELVRMFVVSVLIAVTVAVLSYVLLREGRCRLVAVLVAIPVAVLITIAIQSMLALPSFSIVLILVAIAAPIVFRWIDPTLFRQTWIATGIALAVYLLAFNALLLPYVNHEVVSEVKTLNPEGTARALVVYHPGRSELQERASAAFAEGLAANGWRVDLTTASRQAPTDLSGYDLLVLGTPTYDWAPSSRILRYLKSLGDLQGQRTVLIVSAMRMTGQSLPALERRACQANGEVIQSLPLWASSNERMYGIADPEEIMRQKAGEIPVP
jgi:hypothetical protein